MLKKKQPSKSFLDVSNTYLKGTIPPNPQVIQKLIKRQIERSFDVAKTEDKQKENGNQIYKFCYNALNKYQRSSSQIMNKSFNQMSKKQYQNDTSLNTSTMTPPLTKRFQRKSDRKLEIVGFVSEQKMNNDKQKTNLEEGQIKKQAKQFLRKFQAVQKQNMILKQILIDQEKKISLLSTLIEDKESQIKKTSVYLAQKQNLVKQLEENVISKSKMIIKLQQKAVQLETRLSELKNNRADLNIQAEFTQKINVMCQKLRYRQMQVYMLKKQLFQSKQIQKKWRITSKQNWQLKQRIKFLVKKKYAQQIDRDSVSSLSYSCLSFTTDQISKK